MHPASLGKYPTQHGQVMDCWQSKLCTPLLAKQALHSSPESLNTSQSHVATALRLLLSIMIASYTNSEGAAAGGKNYIYSGADGSLLQTATGTIANVFLGVDALGVGDVNADGNPDYMTTGFGQAYIITFDSSPTALTMSQLSSRSSSPTLPWLAFGLLAAMGGLIIWQQKRRKA